MSKYYIQSTISKMMCSGLGNKQQGQPQSHSRRRRHWELCYCTVWWYERAPQVLRVTWLLQPSHYNYYHSYIRWTIFLLCLNLMLRLINLHLMSLLLSRCHLQILISPNPSLASKSSLLPWSGQIYVQCDGQQKVPNIQVDKSSMNLVLRCENLTHSVYSVYQGPNPSRPGSGRVRRPCGYLPISPGSSGRHPHSTHSQTKR